MKQVKHFLIAAVAVIFANASLHKWKTPKWWGAAMYPSKTSLKMHEQWDHKLTLVAAVKTAGLVETLQGPNRLRYLSREQRFWYVAFLERWICCWTENKSGHWLGCAYLSLWWPEMGCCGHRKTDQRRQWGTAEVKTVAGGKLWLMMKGKDLLVKDEKRQRCKVTIKDVNQRNGVIHVIDHVLMPKCNDPFFIYRSTALQAVLFIYPTVNRSPNPKPAGNNNLP